MADSARGIDKTGLIHKAVRHAKCGRLPRIAWSGIKAPSLKIVPVRCVR